MIIVYLSVLAVSTLLLMWLIKNAKRGFEDEFGFHYGKRIYYYVYDGDVYSKEWLDDEDDWERSEEGNVYPSPDDIPDEIYEECRECYGDGYIEAIEPRLVNSRTISPPYRSYRCDCCGGTGKIKIKVNKRSIG